MQVQNKLSAWLPTIIIVCAILWLTLSPRPTGGLSFRLFPHQDKVAHAVMFGVFTLALLNDSFRAGHPVRLWVASLAGIAFGGVIELAQEALNMGRSAEWADLGADIIGVCTALGVWKLWRNKHS